MPPLPKASETARTCSLASVKLVTDQRNERRYAAYYDTALPPFLSPLQIAPLAAPFPPSPPTPGVTPQLGSFDGGKGRSKGGHSAPSAEAALFGSRPSGATPRERAGSACGLRHRASTVSLADSGESACPVSPASREYPTPLRFRPPKRWAALCVLHALRVARERRSKTKEGGGTPFPPFKIRARKTGTALRKNSASCLSDNPTPTGGEISGRPDSNSQSHSSGHRCTTVPWSEIQNGNIRTIRAE